MAAKILARFSIVICHSGKFLLPHLLYGFMMLVNYHLFHTGPGLLFLDFLDNLFGHRPGRPNSVNTVGIKASVVEHLTIVKVRIQVIHWHLHEKVSIRICSSCGKWFFRVGRSLRKFLFSPSSEEHQEEAKEIWRPRNSLLLRLGGWGSAKSKFFLKCLLACTNEKESPMFPQ